MTQFVLTNIFFLSLGAVLYLMVRALPRIEEDELPPLRKTFLDKFVMSEVPEKLDATVNNYSGKLLRKLKVYLMRFDYYLTGRLQKMNGNPSAGLGANGNGTVNGNGNGNGRKVDYVKEIAAEKNSKGNGGNGR